MSERSKSNKPTPGLVLGGEPRVDLLPPEVHQNTKSKAARRALGFLVVLTLIAVAGGYVFLTIRAAAAQLNLAAAQAHTAELLEEQAQYFEASQAAALVTSTESARSVMTSTEVIWADVFDEISAALPPSSYWEWTSEVHEPWDPPLELAGPLRAPRVATLTLTVASVVVFDATTLFRRFDEIEGFADATVDLVEWNGTTFQTTMTINFGVDALSGRFATEEVTE
jgi:type II secretory pathway pseudopilin PulG